MIGKEIDSIPFDILHLWSEETNLTWEHQAKSRNTYDLEAATFAELEWDALSLETLLDVFDSVKYIVELFIKENEKENNKEHQVSFHGCGNAAEVVLLALLSNSVRIKALDISVEMLSEAMRRLRYEYLLDFAALLHRSNFVNSSWIKSVVKFIENIEEAVNESTADIIRLSTIKLLTDRIQLFQADMTNLTQATDFTTGQTIDLTQSKNDLVMAIASTPHLTNEQFLPYLHTTIETLNPGGTFFFNIRLDPERLSNPVTQLHLEGRIFADNVLNGRWRYFKTFTFSEIADYIYQLSGTPIANISPSQIQQIGPYWSVSLTTTQNVEIAVEFTGITEHWDRQKPPFLGVKIIKMQTKKSATKRSKTARLA